MRLKHLHHTLTHQMRMSTQVSSAKTSTGLKSFDLADKFLKDEKRPNFTREQAIKLIESLNQEERRLFLVHLAKLDQSNTSNIKPTQRELRQVAFHNSIPFIGFGFLDNFIMIIAGEYIDMQLGMTLGISTMAAAACGNTISDLCGIGSAWYVEMAATKLGISSPPKLSPTQMEMTSSKVASNLGRAFGVVLGCIIGMFPLLFIETTPSTQDKEKDEDNDSAKSSIGS